MSKKTQRKFIVYGQSRSGSTLLIDLIDSHPEITCEGELLESDWGYLPSNRLCSLVKLYPYPFFNYRRRLAKTKVYGFKLFCFHLRNKQKAIQRLSRTGWKIIYLKRNNLFEQTISNLIALETKHWHSKPGFVVPTYKVTIPLARLEHSLKTRERWCAFEEASLQGIDFLQIEYEGDLKGAHLHQQAADRVFSYLGLESTPVQSDFRKTDTRSYREILKNYDEILEYIRDTQYGHMVKTL